LSFFFLCSVLERAKKKEEEEGRSGHILRLLRTEQSSSPLSLSLSLFLLRTKQEIIIYIDVVEKEERLEKAMEKKKREKETFRLHTLPCHRSKCCFFFFFYQSYVFF